MTKEERTTNFQRFIEEGQELTTKELTSAGFSKYDLECLRQDVLVREKRGIYTLSNIDLLYSYGRSLDTNDKIEDAIKCYKRCLELDSNYNAANFRLFTHYLKAQDYSEMFKYFDILYLNADELHKRDYNLILLLLANITDIPDKYKDIAANLKLEDVIISDYDYRYDDVEKANVIRIKIFDKDYKFVLNKFRKIIKDGNHKTFNYIIQTLLNRNITKKYCDFVDDLCNLIHAHDYQGFIDRLKNKKKGDQTFSIEQYLLLLAEQIITIEANGELPIILPYQGNYYLEALKRGQYALALTLIEKNNYTENDGFKILKLLLAKIADLINKRETVEESNKKDSLGTREKSVKGNNENTKTSNPNYKTYLELLQAKDYQGLYNILMPRLDNGTIYLGERYLLYLISDLLSIRKTKQIAFAKNKDSYDLFSSIKNQDYEAALNFVKEKLTFNSLIDECIYLVLTDILAEIKSIGEKRNINVISLIKENKYAEIISYYEQKKKNSPISINEEYILRLAQVLINIKDGKALPKATSFGATTVFTAINNNDYVGALILSEKFCQDKGYDKNSNPIYLLLEKINAETNTRKPKKNSLIFDLIRSKNYESIIKYYQDKAAINPLVKIEECILSLSKTIMDLKTKGIIPQMNISSSNNIFHLIDNGDYQKALSMTELYCEQKGIPLEEYDLYYLLTDLLAEINKIEETKIQALNLTPALILQFIKNNEFEKLQAAIRNKQQLAPLNFREETLLKLAGIYLNIRETGNIPNIKCTNASTTAKAIDGNNYSLALNLLKILERKGVDHSKNSLYLMLEKIVNLIAEVKNKKEATLAPSIPIDSDINKEVPTIDMIFTYLSCGKTEYALSAVHKFLEQIGETKYEFLVVNAIKCSILEQDLAFIRPISLLINLKRKTFAFELTKYLEIFYVACDNGEVDLAEIYLEIIKRSKEVFPNNIDINWLSNTLLNAQKKSSERK